MFAYESILVDYFKSYIEGHETPWGEISFKEEFDYQRGRADIVAAADGSTVIAFEAKLNNWRKALHQAYRNKCFANLSYVVLPEKSSRIAAKYLHEFYKRGVGLCLVDKTGMQVITDAESNKPLQPWLHKKAFSYATDM